jgi:hypothetical protein
MPINNLPTHVQTIPAPLPPMIPMPETPWYLGEDYDPSEIVFDDKGGVKAGTLRALVARLTPHGSTCMSFFLFHHLALVENGRLVEMEKGRKGR